MSILRSLVSVLVISSGVALVACGGGGTGSGAPSSAVMDDGTDESEIQSGREGVPRAGAPVGSQAYVEIERRIGSEPCERFQIEVEGMPNGAVIDIWLESPEFPGVFGVVGTLAIGNAHEGEFELSTANGDSLPYGVGAVTGLVGLGLELRTPLGLVLFVGTVPSLGAH